MIKIICPNCKKGFMWVEEESCKPNKKLDKAIKNSIEL